MRKVDSDFFQGTPGAPGSPGNTGPPGKQGDLGPPVSEDDTLELPLLINPFPPQPVTKNSLFF